jgi:hypothetical protein
VHSVVVIAHYPSSSLFKIQPHKYIDVVEVSVGSRRVIEGNTALEKRTLVAMIFARD